MSRKIFPDAAAALDGVLHDGMTVMSGGFGLCGNPENLITGLLESGVKRPTVIVSAQASTRFAASKACGGRAMRAMAGVGEH